MLDESGSGKILTFKATKMRQITLPTMVKKLSKLQKLALPMLKSQEQSLERTAITGEEWDDKLDIIDHVNEDHRAELRYLLQAFCGVDTSECALPIVEDIYEEGVLLRYAKLNSMPVQTSTLLSANSVTKSEPKFEPMLGAEAESMPEAIADIQASSVEDIKANPNSQTAFIAFRINATLEEQFFYLLYEAAIRQGETETLLESKIRYFEVIGTKYVSANMLRIRVKSDFKLPQNAPGYAFQLVLTSFENRDEHGRRSRIKQLGEQLIQKVEQVPIVHQVASQALSTLSNKGQLALFAAFKRLPSRQRNKIARSAGGHQSRYYTLRQLGQDTEGKKDCYQGDIDVYIHGDTPGGNWARSLKAGDVIYSQRDVEERSEHLATGQALLIADESSIPAVAGYLEQWQNPLAPLVFFITQDAKDQNYLSEDILPTDTLLYRYAAHDGVIKKVIDQVGALAYKIDCAWGGLEVSQAKAIKKYLRENHQLMGQVNHVKGYWRHMD